MKYPVMTLASVLMLAPALSHAADAPAFTPAQQEAIGKIAADYLVQHPEVLVQASQKLEAQQQEQQQQASLNAVLQNSEALLNDADTPAIGPKDAKVALVEFFDYQCVYCSHMAPLVEQTVKANPQVRFVFKEWPIFGQRWEPSITAAETGMAVYKEKGADAYFAYHNAIYHTGHDEGKLTQADITAAVKAAGATQPDEATRNKTHAALAKTDDLARVLGFSRTPAFVVMPTQGATAQNSTVLPGAVSAEALQTAINKAQGK